MDHIVVAIAALVGFVAGYMTCRLRFEKYFQVMRWLNDPPKWMTETDDGEDSSKDL